MKKLTYKEYFNKVYGCLIGKTVIGTLGAPFEGIKMPLELKFSEEMINTMLPNDDLDLQVLWLDAVEHHGEDFTSYDLLKRFNERCPYDPGEYCVMRKNFRRGVYPPLSGKFSNDFYIEGMGCPIRAEIWACISPLDVERAVEFSTRDGVLDHAGESVYAENFVVGLETAAFFESDLHKLIEAGLRYVPENSRFRALVEDTVALCDKYDDEKVILRKILKKYGHLDCTNLYENMGITLLALLKGEGDMIKTGMLALNCGFDTDCTCATAGAILGLIKGADRIKEQYGWDNITYVLGVDCPRRSDKVIDLAEDWALLGAHLSNGAITDAPETKFAFKPYFYPLTFEVEYENDDPTFSPEKSCKFTLKIKNHLNETVSASFKMIGAYMDERFSLCVGAGEIVSKSFEAVMPADEKIISDTNMVTVSYDYKGEEKSFEFGVVGAMPWKVIGPIWRTDPICTTEMLIEADMKYDNILNGHLKRQKFTGHRYDIKRAFHLNFAIDTESEYMRHDECFTALDENNLATKYEEAVFYQKEDSIRFSDLCGLRGPSVVYLAREIVSPEDRAVCIMIGQSAPFTLWINGEKVAQKTSCDAFDFENVHLADIPLKKGVNKVLLRLTQVNDDAKYSLTFSKRATCGIHYTDMAAVDPKFF